MTPVRRAATDLLRFVMDHSSGDSREWAGAMLRELDFVENDWDALFWALGSATAVFRHGGFRNWFGKGQRHKEGRMNQSGKNALGVASGIGIGLAISIVVISVHMIWIQYFPDTEGGPIPWRLIMLVTVLPEAAFIATAIALWRKRKPMAVGVLLIAVIAAVHLAFHFAHHLLG